MRNSESTFGCAKLILQFSNIMQGDFDVQKAEKFTDRVTLMFTYTGRFYDGNDAVLIRNNQVVARIYNDKAPREQRFFWKW